MGLLLPPLCEPMISERVTDSQAPRRRERLGTAADDADAASDANDSSQAPEFLPRAANLEDKKCEEDETRQLHLAPPTPSQPACSRSHVSKVISLPSAATGAGSSAIMGVWACVLGVWACILIVWICIPATHPLVMWESCFVCVRCAMQLSDRLELQTCIWCPTPPETLALSVQPCPQAGRVTWKH